MVAKTGVLLGAIALLLAVVGVAIGWTNQAAEEKDAGVYRTGGIGELCKSVDTKPLKELAPKEEGNDSSAEPDATPPTFNCEVRMVSKPDAGEYRTVGLTMKVRVAETITAAGEAYHGLIDVDESEQGKTSKATNIGEEAVSVAFGAQKDSVQCRLHARDSNAIFTSTVVMNGSGTKCDGEMTTLLTKLTKPTIDVIRSE